MNRFTLSCAARVIAAALPLFGVPAANADVITDWNTKTGELLVESKLGTPPAIRVMALVQTAAYGAVQTAGRDASVDAAVAAAHRVALTKLLPAQQTAIDAAYQAAIAAIADGPAKAAGIAAGERAATAVLAQRAVDSVASPDTYRPHAAAGAYVPTASPAAFAWTQRSGWALSTPSQFRGASPVALTSDAWARDYNEVREFGAKNSTRRTTEQTDIARFWEYSLPPIYTGVVRSVAVQPGRDVVANARLYAAATQALDDALIAVFDTKYTYNFWRPATAIRNGDIDGNDATQRDATWASLIDAPMHPEYPSAHSALAAAVGAVLKAEFGSQVLLSTSSPTAKGATRKWASVDDFVREVGDARIYAGIHYRSSVEAGAAMGRRVGEQVASRVLVTDPARSAGQSAPIQTAGN